MLLLPYMLVGIGQTRFSLFLDLVITVIQRIASSNLMRQLQVHDTKVDMGMEVAA